MRTLGMIWDALVAAFKVIVVLFAVVLLALVAMGGRTEMQKAPAENKAAYYVSRLESTEDYDEFVAIKAGAGLDWVRGNLSNDEYDHIWDVYDAREEHVRAVSDKQKAEEVLAKEGAK